MFFYVLLCFGHLDFDHSDLFRISDFDIQFYFSATKSTNFIVQVLTIATYFYHKLKIVDSSIYPSCYIIDPGTIFIVTIDI